MRTSETEKKIREAYGKILSGMQELADLGLHARLHESFACANLYTADLGDHPVDTVRVGNRQVIILADYERDKPWCDAVEKAIASVPVIRV